MLSESKISFYIADVISIPEEYSFLGKIGSSVLSVTYTHVCVYIHTEGERASDNGLKSFIGVINLSKSNTKYAANSETHFSEINKGENSTEAVSKYHYMAS